MAIDLHQLGDGDVELIDHAHRIAEEQSDGRIHTVGCAVRASDGSIYGGINLYHFNGGPCAELVALATARANGARTILTIVAVGHDGRGVISPCGRDRQILLDYHPQIRVILPTGKGVRSVAIADLLPFSFVWDPAG